MPPDVIWPSICECVPAIIERQRAIAAGFPPDAEPHMQLRDDRAVK